MLCDKREARLRSFFDDHLSIHSVIIAFSSAVDDAEPRARPERGAQATQERNRPRDFVISLEQEHGLNTASRQQRVVRLPKDGANVRELLAFRPPFDMADEFRIDL